jgi:virulence-associated protein VagC
MKVIKQTLVPVESVQVDGSPLKDGPSVMVQTVYDFEKMEPCPELVAIELQIPGQGNRLIIAPAAELLEALFHTNRAEFDSFARKHDYPPAEPTH